jgi:cytochrome c5
MKKYLAIIFIIMAVSCSKKALPTVERRTEEPPAPVVEINLATGQRLYTTRCARCHDLPKITKYNNEGWQPILSSMIPKAGLSGAEAANVRAYI